MALKRRAVALAGALLLASTAMAVAQQSTPPVPPQIDPNPWIPPRPPGPVTSKAVANWLRMTSPKITHILPVRNRNTGRWHHPNMIRGGLEATGYQGIYWSGLVLAPGGTNGYDSENSSNYFEFTLPTTTVPSTGCGSYGCGVAIWAGFGGSGIDSSTDLTQAGFDVYFETASSSAQLIAFYEQYPQESEVEVNLTFNFGDDIATDVGPGGWYLTDYSNDTAISGNWDYSVAEMSTAEVIAEAFGANGGQVTLANYGDIPSSGYAYEYITQQNYCSLYNGGGFPPDYYYAPTDDYFELYQGGQYVSYPNCNSTMTWNFYTEGTGY